MNILCLQDAQLTNGYTNKHLWSMEKKNRLTASNFCVVLSAIKRQRYVWIVDVLVQIY